MPAVGRPAVGKGREGEVVREVARTPDAGVEQGAAVFVHGHFVGFGHGQEDELRRVVAGHRVKARAVGLHHGVAIAHHGLRHGLPAGGVHVAGEGVGQHRVACGCGQEQEGSG